MCLHDVLRPAADLDGVFAGREIHGLAVGSVNLIVKKEVGREPPRRIREHIAPTIANDERCRGWLAIKILHTEHHLHRRSRVEQNRHRVAKAEILRPLPDIESELRLAPPDLARVKLDDAIPAASPDNCGFSGCLSNMAMSKNRCGTSSGLTSLSFSSVNGFCRAFTDPRM